MTMRTKEERCPTRHDAVPAQPEKKWSDMRGDGSDYPEPVAENESGAPELTMREWQRQVLDAEELSDWTIKIAADGYCWKESKTIQITADCSPAWFLHEVAHALYQEPEGPLQNHYHGGEWASTYARLVDAYLVTHAKHAALERELETVRQWNADLSKRLGKPRCLDCNAAGIINCSHFDNCDGRWEYALEAQVESLKAALRECRDWVRKPDSHTNAERLTLIGMIVDRVLADAAPAVCGKATRYHLIAGASSYACALPVGHDGDCQPGGTCFKHGPWVGLTNGEIHCPKWPDCIMQDAASAGKEQR